MDPIIILGIVLALLFNFANGLNDAANSIATIIATKALTPPLQAVLLAGGSSTSSAPFSSLRRLRQPLEEGSSTPHSLRRR